VIDTLVAHMRDGRIADGFVIAVELCGDKLAQHFPRRPTSRDELPDRLYLI
jgi:putative membrane protein